MFAKKWITTAVVLFGTMILLASWGTNGVSAQSANDRMEKAKAIQIELGDGHFNPKIITLQHGRSTIVILKNVGKEEHAFTVKKLAIDVEVKPGKTKTITVNPKKPGTYKLICRYHKNKGMIGKVIVK